MEEMEIVRSAQISGLHLFLDSLAYRTPHMHREFELLWVLRGALTAKGEGFDCTAGPGGLLLFNPCQTHEFRAADGPECLFLCMQLAPELVQTAYPAADKLRLNRMDPSCPLPPETAARVKAGLLAATRAYLRRPAGYELFCAGQAQLVLFELMQALPVQLLTEAEKAEKEKRSARLLRLLRFVDERYAGPCRLGDFAAGEGRSLSYLSHFVRQALGQSFQEYVTGVRFNAACRRIAAGENRMLDVCLASGFSDYRYFCRAFRRRMGVTPETYRQNLHRAAPPDTVTHHSLHSLERFYTRGESLRLLDELAGPSA